MTKAHNDRIVQDGGNKGYSIRVGKNLPKNSANLAYVSTPAMGPKVNLLINDVSNKITENGLPSIYQQEKIAFPDDSFLLRELSGASTIPSNNVVLTDEFSVPSTGQDMPTPLYYRAKTKGYFDAKGATVVPYISGYSDRPAENPRDYVQLTFDEKEDMLYLGTKIKINYLDGSDLKKEHKYKIHLVREEGSTLPANTYSIYIYSNFRGNENETFAIRYEKYNTNGSHVKDYVEILNAYPFFEEVNVTTLEELAATPKANNIWKSELGSQEYAVVEAGEGKYQVYAPSQVIVANDTTRPAHQFKYKIKADLTTRFSVSNPGVVNIGIAYLNSNIFGVENLTSTLWKMYESKSRPAYLEFQNPHPATIDSIKNSSRYWTVDLEMPAEHWDDYDIIILSGYGFFDMSQYNDNLRQFLENGGKLWIDNAGSGHDVLTFTKVDGTETFLTNVGFLSIQNTNYTIKTGDTLASIASQYKVTTDALIEENSSISNLTTYITNAANVGNVIVIPVPYDETGFKTASTSSAGFLDRLYMITDAQIDIGYQGVNPKITFGSGESSSSWSTAIKYSNNHPSIIHKKIYGLGTIIVSNCGVFRALFHNEDEDMKFAINTVLYFAEKRVVHTPYIQDYVYHRDNLFTQEYKNVNGTDAYRDDRNDIDNTQIVAKKIISNTVYLAMQPYLDKSFYSATGTYQVEVQSNNEVPLLNASFETGAFNQATNKEITSWTVTTDNVFTGWSVARLAGSTAQFKHQTSISQRGSKSISVEGAADSVGTQAYWHQLVEDLVPGTYRATIWMKVSNVDIVSGSGATIGIYNTSGEKIVVSDGLIGTRDWTEVTVDFSVDTTQDVYIRLGFVDGNGSGKVEFDYVTLNSIGSVYMTPNGNGNKMLYAYATKPKSQAINLQAEGFVSSDITTYDPEVDVTYTVRAYVYRWDNYLGRNMRYYGKYSTYKKTIRRSDGIVSLGSLSTLIPEIQGGAEWADSNKIYYEVLLGGPDGVDSDSQFVNLEIYDTQTGNYFYSKEGEILIRNMDLFNNGEQKQIILQARTNYYTIRATKRRYGLFVQDESKISLAYPPTIDDRDSWFLRVRNGGFIKKQLSYSEWKDLQNYDSRYFQFQQQTFGTHTYMIPEYERQVFKPKRGIKKVHQEVAEYIDDNTIRVQNAPLYVLQGNVRGEQLDPVDDSRRIFKAENNGWLDTFLPKVYIDQDHNGSYLLITSGFHIDYENGCIVFTTTQDADVKADYDYNNLEVVKRSYSNVKVSNERMLTSDKRTFTSKHKRWLAHPVPVVKTIPYSSNKSTIVPPTSFTIDYEDGEITFKQDVNGQVYVDYSYSTDTDLVVRDYDIQNGLIYLETPIDFKDEIYVNYYYEENFVEYRGYYNEDAERFIYLDLNPSEGHYCTMRSVRNGRTIYEEVPTAKLMNKEVYVYIVPYQDSFGNRNKQTLRHCYSLTEWQQVQKTTPNALLLGVIHLREHTKVTDAVVLDTRTRGGGLKEEISEAKIKKTQPLSFNYWDMGTWDGKAYYKNGTIVIEIPKSILRSEGGQFTEQQVRDIVDKYIAYGIYYIIEYV